MKKIKPALLIVLVAVLASACSKKSNTTPKPTSNASMSFKLNGTPETTSMVVAIYAKAANNLSVTGTFGTTGITMVIPLVKVGTFDVATNAVTIIYAPDAVFNDTYFGITGSVVISTFTADTVTGTFSFTGKTGTNITGSFTEGTFSAKLLTQ